MTPETFTKMMHEARRWRREGESEQFKSDGIDIMCDCLTLLGYGEGVRVFLSGIEYLEGV